MVTDTRENQADVLAQKKRLRALLPGNGKATELLTTGDLALMLNTTKVTIQQWANKGLINCFRLPGSVKSPRRFHLKDVRTFVKANKLPIARFDEIILTTQEVAKAGRVSTFTAIAWMDADDMLPSFWMVSRRLAFYKDVLEFFEKSDMDTAILIEIAEQKGPGFIQQEKRKVAVKAKPKKKAKRKKKKKK